MRFASVSRSWQRWSAMAFGSTRSQGTIRIHAPELLEELVESFPYTIKVSDESLSPARPLSRDTTHVLQSQRSRAHTAHSPNKPYTPTVGVRPLTTATSTSTIMDPRKMKEEMLYRIQKRQERLDTLREQARKKLEDDDKKVKEIVQRRLKQKEENLLATLDQIDEEQEFIRSMENYLNEVEEDSQRRREKLYQEWLQQIYMPIQKQIESQLQNVTTAEIEKRRLELFDEFLETLKKCPRGVFRDIVTKDLYDPFKSKNFSITYNDRTLRNPCQRELDEMEEEEKQAIELKFSSTASSNLKASRKQTQERRKNFRTLGKEVLDILKWDKLDSTPYGRYEPKHLPADPSTQTSVGIYPYINWIMPAEANKRPPRVNLQASSVQMDHYNVAAEASVIKQEYFPRGKKVFPEKLPKSQF